MPASNRFFVFYFYFLFFFRFIFENGRFVFFLLFPFFSRKKNRQTKKINVAGRLILLPFVNWFAGFLFSFFAFFCGILRWRPLMRCHRLLLMALICGLSFFLSTFLPSCLYRVFPCYFYSFSFCCCFFYRVLPSFLRPGLPVLLSFIQFYRVLPSFI